MSDYRLTYGNESVLVSLGMPEHTIYVDGQATQYQNADGRCDVDRCMRLAASTVWGPVYEDWEAAEADDRVRSDNICVWDDVEYERVEDEEEEEESDAD